MRIGTSLQSSFTASDLPLARQKMVEWTRAARSVGLDSIFVGDHHAMGIPYFQNTPLLGRLLAEWGDNTAGALFVLPIWHPVLLAEQVGTLAALTNGPFVLQCALGGQVGQFEAFGIMKSERVDLFEASLQIIRRLLAGEKVSTEHPYRLRAAQISPIPSRPIEMWVAGAARSAIDRAARLRCGWVARPGISLSEAREQARFFRERCAVYGHEPPAVAIRRDIHVGANDSDARRVAEPILEAGYRSISPIAPVVGGVEQVAETFSDLANAGYTEVLVRHLASDQTEILKSFDRLGEVRRLVADA